MVVFEDEFTELSDKWKKVGTHTNFSISAENNKLKFTFGWMEDPSTPHVKRAWAGVVYDEPFDLTRKRVSITIDMTPKFRPLEGVGLYYNRMGFMVGNKKLPPNVGLPISADGLPCDPFFKAIGCVTNYIGGIPADVLGFKFDGYDYNIFGRVMAGYPPLEMMGEYAPNKVNLIETGAPVAEYVPHFDLSKAYLYLVFFTTEVAKTTSARLLPDFGYVDYVRIDVLPPEPLTAFFGQTMAVTLTTTLMMMNAMLIIRGLRLIRW